MGISVHYLLHMWRNIVSEKIKVTLNEKTKVTLDASTKVNLNVSTEEIIEEKKVTTIEAPEKVTGYRSLTSEEIQLMNDAKEKGNRIGALLEKLKVEVNPDVANELIAAGNDLSAFTHALQQRDDIQVEFVKFGDEIVYQTMNSLFQMMGTPRDDMGDEEMVAFIDYCSKHIQMAFPMIIRGITKPSTFV